MSDTQDEPDDEGSATADTGAPNVADAAHVVRRRRDTRRKARREEDERQEFWINVLSTPIGRREMWGILDAGHAFSERFATGPNGFPQPEATWKEAGEQSLAFRIYLSWLRLAPEEVALMMRENHPSLSVAASR